MDKDTKERHMAKAKAKCKIHVDSGRESRDHIMKGYITYHAKD